MDQTESKLKKPSIDRRRFVQSVAAVGAGMAMVHPTWVEAQAGSDDLKIAIIGAGSQGRNLIINCLRIPGLYFAAVCDIWPYHQKYAANILKKYDQPVNVYADYRHMLAEESDLDAVIVASPDWMHAPHTMAALDSGHHVYCEKEMSNKIDDARQMVLSARRTGKHLQIGHQRRSNLRYHHGIKLIDEDKVLGRITHVNGQWNRAGRLEQGWPKSKALDQETLEKYGYKSMDQLRNWRWYRKFAGGPMADLGSHQVDVFNWFLKTPPKSVLAAGGQENYPDSEWYDHVIAIYEWQTDVGMVRGFYQVLNTTSHGGFYETFMGDQGSMVISEDTRKGHLFREIQAKRRDWEDVSEKVEAMGKEAVTLKLGETLDPNGEKSEEGQKMLDESKKPVHQLHLENFFSAIRNDTPLSCPPEVGFETAVSVLRANDAVSTACRVELAPENFRV